MKSKINFDLSEQMYMDVVPRWSDSVFCDS